MRKEKHLVKKIGQLADQISSDKTVAVSERDLLYLFATLEELNSFFHQPMNYETIEQLDAFLGAEGGYDIIWNTYYKKAWEMLPPSIQNMIENR